MSTNPQQFFENLMNPNKEIRELAERDLEKLKELPFTTSFPIFQSGMLSTNTNVAQLSTLLFKKTYLDNAKVKSMLPPDIVDQMKSFLKSLICFNSNTEWKMLRRIADALAQLYQLTDLKANFGEIICWFNNQEPLARRFAIYIIEVLCELEELKDDIISGSIEDIKQMFIKGLKDSNRDVSESTFKATTQFLINLKDESVLLSFASLGDVMLETLLISLGHNEDGDKTVLESLNYLTDYHPTFWKERIQLIVEVVCKIASNKQFKSFIRELALEIVYSLSKNSPKLIRESKEFKVIFVPLMFQLLYEIDNVDSNANWEKLLSEDENDLDDMYYAIKKGFDRLSLNLTGEYFMQVTQGYITKYIESSNWIEINGAFTALAAMAEGCKEVFKAHLLNLLNYISKGLIHEHLRVRYSALAALGALLNQTSPIPQKKYCSNIIQGLAILMTDKEPSLKVKTKACCSLLDFLNGLLINNEDTNENASIIMPYSDDLIKLLSSLFEMSLSINYPPLQEYSLNNISILANLLDKSFIPYYDQIMPGLKKLFYTLQPTTPQIKKLKSHLIETISYLFAGVSENIAKYMDDLNELSQAFAKALEVLPEEDPQLPAIFNAFTHISLLMEGEFVPYLQFLFPILERYITADIGLKVENTEDREYIPEETMDETERAKIGSVQVNMGTKSMKLSLNTFALQTKLLGLTILNEICLNMGKSFMPFTEKFLMLSKSLLNFPYSRKLRKVAIRSVASCMNCCTDDSDKRKIINFFGTELLREFNESVKKCHFHEMKTYVKTLNECASLIKDKTVFNEQFIIKLFSLLGEGIKNIISKKKEIENLKEKNEGKDENDENDQQLDLQNLNKLIHKITELNGRIFGIFGNNLTDQVINNLFDSFISIWNNGLNNKKFASISEEEILSSVSFFDDFLEYSEISCFNKFYMTYIELSLKCQTENEEILQSIVFGYGVICRRVDKAAFESIRNLIYKAIMTVIERPLNDANEKTYDNGIGAFGKYVYYQIPIDNNGILLANRFIKLLPLKHDLLEGKSVAIEFCKKIEENHALIINELNIQFAQQALVDIIQLNKKEQFLEENDIASLEHQLNWILNKLEEIR